MNTKTTDEIIQSLENVRYHLTSSKHKNIIDEAIQVLITQQSEIDNIRTKTIDEITSKLKDTKIKICNDYMIYVNNIDVIAKEMELNNGKKSNI